MVIQVNPSLIDSFISYEKNNNIPLLLF